MMFPHTITIYRHTVVNDSDVIAKQTVKGFYWYGSSGIAVGNKGVTGEDSATVVSSPERAAYYGTEWTVQPGDRIVKGEGASVTRLKDIVNGITVLKVDENVCGSAVDNITIMGK